MEAEQRRALLDLMRERAFKVGDFLLSSGRRSSYYFDGRMVTLDPLGALFIKQKKIKMINNRVN
jgi:orotate phosphoribosyltransferase